MNDSNSNEVIPRVSMAIPVYNGENYLKEAIESHLAQTFEDFELLITDNASTDGTRDICESYAKQDDRIQYIRREKNIGGSNNFNDAFELAKGEYFKWSAHDDICSPNFLQSCVEKLDSDPSVILCTGKEIAIDENGEIIEGYMDKYQELKNLDSTSAHIRFRDFSCSKHGCYKVFGLVRSSSLRMTPKLMDYIGADKILLAELALLGRIWESPEPIYFRRHSEQYCALKDNKVKIHWWNIDSKEEKIFRASKNCIEYIRAIHRVKLSFSEKVLCNLVMMNWIRKKRKPLLEELIMAIK